MSFKVQHEKTRLFACQNPLNQGGGRKGLPKSFLNRFTQVITEFKKRIYLNFFKFFKGQSHGLAHKAYLFKLRNPRWRDGVVRQHIVRA